MVNDEWWLWIMMINIEKWFIRVHSGQTIGEIVWSTTQPLGFPASWSLNHSTESPLATNHNPLTYALNEPATIVNIVNQPFLNLQIVEFNSSIPAAKAALTRRQPAPRRLIHDDAILNAEGVVGQPSHHPGTHLVRGPGNPGSPKGAWWWKQRFSTFPPRFSQDQPVVKFNGHQWTNLILLMTFGLTFFGNNWHQSAGVFSTDMSYDNMFKHNLRKQILHWSLSQHIYVCHTMSYYYQVCLTN